MKPSHLQPHVPTLGVSVDAVKEQLLLLGHTIPDHVIKAFLDNGLPGLQDAGASKTPLHSVPEAHAASTPGTDTHAGNDKTPGELHGYSRALSGPQHFSISASARESDPVHSLHTGTMGMLPLDKAATAIAAPALACFTAQQTDERADMASQTALAAEGVAAHSHTQASASRGSEGLQEGLQLSATATNPCAAASSTSVHLSAGFAGLQIGTEPAAERSHAVHPSDTPRDSARVKHATASLAPAVAGGAADSAHAHAASAQPAGCSSSAGPEQASAMRPLPSQARSWRQLISQPLYPERLPAACQGQRDASSGPDLVHAAARKQDCPPASFDESYSHCNASPRREHNSCSGRAAVKGKAWSADLYKELPGILGSSTAAAQAPASHDASAVQEGSLRPSGAEHAKRTGSAPLRSKTALRQAPCERPALAAPGKENNKQQSQAEQRHRAEQLQKRAGHQRSAPQESTMKDKTPPYGSPRSVQTSSLSTPRLGPRGPKRLDRVARFRQMQAIWAGDAFLKSGAAGANGAGKRKKLGFCKAFADVHAANERMHNLFVDWSAANC